MATRVAGIALVEGDPSGDGRMWEHGALNWEGVLPIALVWDREEGDHTAMTVGAIDTIERRENGIIWVEGFTSDSADADLSLGLVPTEADADGERVIVGKFAVDDALEVTTFARPRHLAIVDTAAWAEAKISIVTGAIAAAGVFDEWAGKEHYFHDPKFGDFSADSRLRYDPDRSVWSCPPTLIEDGPDAGRVFGHITPMGICLRGRPDRCVTPPDGDLEGFMRGRAPAAGGLRTGVICCGGNSSHCDVGIGAARATEHYDKVGRAVADVRVGRDRYGVWFSGMARPGASKEDLYAFAASDVSGHWEYSQAGRMTLVGLPSVNVGGFPKGWMTYDEFRGGLAAAGGITIEEGCGSWTSGSDDVDVHALTAEVQRIGFAVGEMYAAHLLARDHEPA